MSPEERAELEAMAAGWNAIAGDLLDQAESMTRNTTERFQFLAEKYGRERCSADLGAWLAKQEESESGERCRFCNDPIETPDGGELCDGCRLLERA